jgi:hypothetical protein
MIIEENGASQAVFSNSLLNYSLRSSLSSLPSLHILLSAPDLFISAIDISKYVTNLPQISGDAMAVDHRMYRTGIGPVF